MSKFTKFFNKISTAAVISTAIVCCVQARPGPHTGWYNPQADTLYIADAIELIGLAMFVNGTGGGAPFGPPLDFAGKTIILKNDISFESVEWDGAKGWTPIGSHPNNPFSGTFDGGGNIISGLYINDEDGDYIGLFGVVSGGTVKNLGIEGANITGHYMVGAVAGILEYGDITRCYSTGTIRTTYIAAGGIAGLISNGSVVTDCYSTADVIGVEGVGGIVGILSRSGYVINTYSIGAVIGGGGVGGIVGRGEPLPAIAPPDAPPPCVLINSAALNPSVTRELSNGIAGRVAGASPNHIHVLSNNTAFTGMNVNFGMPTGLATNMHGADITINEIHADGTLGGRFTSENGWTTENGKLPGLFGNAVNMPEHLGGSTSISYNRSRVSSLIPAVSVRGRTLNVKLPQSSVTQNLQVRMIDMRGRTAANFKIVNGIDNSFSLTKIPAGRYIVEIKNAGSRVNSMPVVIR